MQEQTLHPARHFSLRVSAAQGHLIAALENLDAPSGKSEPVRMSIVIDRSGSMSGDKMMQAATASARMVRSLTDQDRVAAIAFDDRVEVLADPQVPDEVLARRLERLDSRGSTNLYGGWLAGAKRAGKGGRVLLLSDGMANVGRYSDAVSLAAHAEKSRREFGVITSTIGVGADYDEFLMSEMARAGGGNHYFAHTPEAIQDAFSRERFAAEALVAEESEILVDSFRQEVGSFWAEEKRTVVIPIGNLPRRIVFRYRLRESKDWIEVEIPAPTEFSQDAPDTLEVHLHELAELERQSALVRSPDEARSLSKRMREALLGILAHPLANEPGVAARITAAERTLDRLEALARHYEEASASVHRKMSHQRHFNDRNRTRAFSSFEDEKDLILVEKFRMVRGHEGPIPVDPSLLSGVPPVQWQVWLAAPLARVGDLLIVGCPDPSDGFLLDEIRKATKVRAQLIAVSPDAIRERWQHN